MLSELVRRGLVVLVVLGVFLRCTLTGLWFGGDTSPQLTGSKPRGLEWRSIRRLPTGRLVAVRLQVLIA